VARIRTRILRYMILFYCASSKKINTNMQEGDDCESRDIRWLLKPSCVSSEKYREQFFSRPVHPERECAYEHQCEAVSKFGYALKEYLTPAETKKWHREGVYPYRRKPCILCLETIRESTINYPQYPRISLLNKEKISDRTRTAWSPNSQKPQRG
jgi:hypothetical protein